MSYEYRVKPVARYNLTEHYQDPSGMCGHTKTIGEFPNKLSAEVVAAAMAQKVNGLWTGNNLTDYDPGALLRDIAEDSDLIEDGLVILKKNGQIFVHGLGPINGCDPYKLLEEGKEALDELETNDES